MSSKINISAIIASHNEAHLLRSSLPNLSFCSEVIVVDLESQDDTQTIVKQFGYTLLSHKNWGIIEPIHQKIIPKLKNEWVLITDPDEVISHSLVKKLIDLFTNNTIPDNIGSITTPMFYYFKGKRLKGTPWGGINSRILLINKTGITLSPKVHDGPKLKPGYQNLNLQIKEANTIYHYWMQTYAQLLEKHLRYLKNEGESRFFQGERATIFQILIHPFQQFVYSYIIKKGYLDGLVGIFLSLFWAWYQTAALISLYRYQKNRYN